MTELLLDHLDAGERWPSWDTYDRIAAAFGRACSFECVAVEYVTKKGPREDTD